MKVKRIKRFFFNKEFDLEECTGVIFFNNNLLNKNNTRFEYKVNITHLWIDDLIPHHLDRKNLKYYFEDNYEFDPNSVHVNTIYNNKKRIIYLVNVKNNIDDIDRIDISSLLSTKDYQETNDIYKSILNNFNKKMRELQLIYDEKNYIKFYLNEIFYYLIGDENVNI